jgi:hypothetical protein
MRTNPHAEKLQRFTEEINSYEAALEEKHRRMMQEEMGAYLEQKDREASQEIVAEGGYESRGVVKRRILTSCGVISVRVRRYRRKNGQTRYPLRDVCGVNGITGRARDRCVRFAVERSYAWSAEVLKEICGMELGRMRLWTVIQQEGQKEEARIEEERKKVFEEARGERETQQGQRPAVVQMDGTMIASRESVERDRFGRKRMEVKVGVLFRGTLPQGKRRRRTVQRRVYARVTDAESFGEQWYTHCCLNGLGSSEPVHVVGDGAAWIRNVQRAMFPGSRYTLDLYHLKENARRVLLDHQQENFLSLVSANQAQAALRYLKQLHPSDKRHAEELRNFQSYVEENIDGMQYSTTEIRGSGVIEKMADTVVKKRMKRQGMSWSRPGANNILALRTRYINEQHSKSDLTVSPS